MAERLKDMRIAVLATDGFEESELKEPVDAFREEGADVRIIAPKGKSIRGWRHGEWGSSVPVDVELLDAVPGDFDALHLPGGVMNPDRLRMNPDALGFVQAMDREGKPIAAICHAPWLLVEAGLVKGRTLTSWPSLKTDLANAGAMWVDREVVVDGNIITSRKPDDIPAYNEACVIRFAMALTPLQS